MAGFIPELTTRITVNVNSNSMDDAISKIESDPFLSQCGELIGTLQEMKSTLDGLVEPVGAAVAERLQSNQETIISTKHYITGMMANSVDISQDGHDFIVGNTAHSIDGFPYPLAIVHGRRAVYPIEKKVLRWFEGGQIGGTPIFSHYSSSVPADPFVEPSINTTIEDIQEIVAEQIKGAFK